MKYILFTLILFVSVSQIGLAQEGQSKSFEEAFKKGGEKIEQFQKEFWTSDKTEKELLEELEADLRPVFKDAFMTQLDQLGQEAQDKANKTNFKGNVLSIEEVDNEIGELLASKIRPEIPVIYDEELDSLIFKYRKNLSIDSAKTKMANNATSRIMDIYREAVQDFLQQRKESWANVSEKSDLDKAQDAVREKRFIEAMSLVKKARDNGEIGDNQVGEYAINFATKALSASFYKDAAKLADEAYNNGIQKSIVNQLKYQIYDQAYESAKEADDRSKARQLRKIRNDYRKWKP